MVPWTYDYLSPGIKRLTGYSAEEIREIGFSSLVVRIDLPQREDVPPTEIARNRVEGRTGEFRADYLIRTRKGEHKWLRDHSFPWADNSGEVVGSVGILSDISEYRRAEALVRERTAELIESEEKYRTLVENVPLVVYRMGAGGRVLFLNSFIEEVFGYTPVEILADPDLWDAAVYEEDAERVRNLRRKGFSRGEECIGEYRVRHKNGHLVHVLDHAIPSLGPDGTVRSVDGIIIDVTGRIKLQERLIQAEGLRTIGEVSMRLAHEIRNPLVSAGGFARRLLSSMNPEDPNREKVQIIVKEVGRLELILRMILTYIQPLELDVSPIQLNRPVEAALKAEQPAIEERGLHLDLHLGTELPEIPADPSSWSAPSKLSSKLRDPSAGGEYPADFHPAGRGLPPHGIAIPRGSFVVGRYRALLLPVCHLPGVLFGYRSSHGEDHCEQTWRDHPGPARSIG